MKKLLLVFIFSIPVLLNAQTPIPNGGMENWENVGSSTEEPIEWSSNKTGGGNATLPGQTCFREAAVANIHSGTYGARIRTTTFFGTPVNGVMTLGRVQAPTTTPSDGFNETVLGDLLFSEATNAVPDSIVFWAKYVPQDATDSARMSMIIHDNYSLNDPQEANGTHVRAKAVRNFRTGGAWVRMAIPFVTINSGVAPVYMLCTFTSSKTPGVGTNNTILYIDDVSLIYNPPSIVTGTINPLTYYISSTAGAPVTVPYTIGGVYTAGNVYTAQLSNAAGSFAAPTNIGTLTSTASGSIAATIPVGTTPGTGYRIRVISSTPAITGTTNTSDITVNLVSNSIAPTAPQTIQTNTNGTVLTVTESAGFISREWKYSTTPGGPYLSFAPTQTGTSYTPNFATSGNYYVVCQTNYPNSLVVTSNEVQINAVGNSVTPSGSQSILVGNNGTTLNVTESPAGTAREWMYSNTPGGPYVPFAPVQTGMSYIPNFASTGVYYVVCVSTISSFSCISNEVVINVGSVTLTTGTIAGSPFEFSPSAPDAAVVVPYTISTPADPGNVFTAQLSDPFGSFALPTTIGSVSTVTSGTINATINHNTIDGAAYRIRVIASNPSILGADNGVDIIIDQFDNSATPSAPQNILYGVNGTPITVAESQSATRNWKFATVPGGPYSLFSPAETGTTYTPNFALPGTYYVVCVSENIYNDTVVTNEVQINVANGTILNTTAVGTSTYYLSPNALVTDVVDYTSDILFSSGNVFTAEISDAFGSFASPVSIGTLTSDTVAPISVNIPNGLPSGTTYRIRVNSSLPPTIGTPNPVDLTVIQFETSAAPADTQFIGVSVNGTSITVSPTHITGVSNEWKYKTGIGNYTSFIPAETGVSYTPNFGAIDQYNIVCFSVNMWNDTIQTDPIIVYVTNAGVNDDGNGKITTVWYNDVLNIDLTQSLLINPSLEILNMSGQVIYTNNMIAQSNNAIPLQLSAGLYVCRIIGNNKVYTIKFVKP